MKKIFTLLVMALVSLTTMAQTDTWSVCGTIPGLAAWDNNDTKGDMTSDDGVVYTLTLTDVTLEKGVTYEFKVIYDHKWDTAYPASNYSFTVTETAAYTVEVTFNSTSHDINVTTTKTGAGVVIEKTYSIVGSLTGGWEADVVLVKGDDGIYTATVSNVAAGSYQFKVRVNNAWAESYPSKNVDVTVETDGSDVVVTFNADTKEVSHTVKAPTTGIAAPAAATAEGQRFSVSGQKVSASYRGLVIVDGRKVMQR